MTPVTATAPAKLVVSGEYAVLEAGEPAIVAAIDRYTEATVVPADTMRLTAPALGREASEARYEAQRWRLRDDAPEAAFVSEALSATLTYLQERGHGIAPFHLALSPALAEDGVKIGLGGSAATTVAIVAAILAAYGEEAAPDVVYRLAAIAHLRAQGSGSGIDVAASTYGGVLSYTSHHPDWLLERLAEESSLVAIVDGPWPHLRAMTMTWPASWHFMVAWTGKSASTPAYLQKLSRFKKAADPRYGVFLREMGIASRDFACATQQADASMAKAALARGRSAMLNLGEALETPLETPQLERLAEAAAACGTAGKPSGAGGGDCGISVAFDAAQAACLRSAWQDAGLRPLALAIAPTGVRIRPA